MRILQTNLGPSRRAQDLLYQTIRESTVALAVVAEPYRVLDAPDWARDTDKMVAVSWTSTPGAFAHGIRLERGNGYVPDGQRSRSSWMGLATASSGTFLGRCSSKETSTHTPRNGKAPETPRAAACETAGLGLLLVNRGSANTCVAWKGSSIVDITRASPDTLRRISGWRVAEEVEALSDHLYIFTKVKDILGPRTVTAGDGRDPPRKGRAHPPPRWNIKERDDDLLRAAAIVVAWTWFPGTAWRW
ncbi:uncharacterized protein LOC122571717 [Bombus pyrosoma]|uniref:uncharacterized protein LOC122571717 n=1 Tax=Bombus pyrosoma TaxID=396416 RepID=UPI001CB956BB|nr:uncharacterized protein LOC122571717 [Bombus pyrosoma]